MWFEQTGNDLKISVIGTTDSVTVDEWFTGTSNRLDLEAGDSYTLTDVNVQALITAMSSFSPPALGETDLDPGESYYASVSSAISSN